MDRIWLGLTGDIGCGKDTAAATLRAQYGFYRVAFADPMTDALSAMLKLPARHFTDRYLKEQPLPRIGKSPRDLKRTLGTEWGREIVHPDLWVMLAEIEADNHDRVVFTDVRFNNEAEMIHKNGGIIWQIARPGNIADKSHKSDDGIDEKYIDRIILNDGTLVDFCNQIDAFGRILVE